MRFRLHSQNASSGQNTPSTTTSVTDGSTALVSSGAVFTAIDNAAPSTMNVGGVSTTTGGAETLYVDGDFRVNGGVHLGVMPALHQEGAVRLGGDQPGGRWHSIACYNSNNEANNYMAFNLHAGDTTAGADYGINEQTNEILRLRGDGNVAIGLETATENLK